MTFQPGIENVLNQPILPVPVNFAAVENPPQPPVQNQGDTNQPQTTAWGNWNPNPVPSAPPANEWDKWDQNPAPTIDANVANPELGMAQDQAQGWTGENQPMTENLDWNAAPQNNDNDWNPAQTAQDQGNNNADQNWDLNAPNAVNNDAQNLDWNAGNVDNNVNNDAQNWDNWNAPNDQNEDGNQWTGTANTNDPPENNDWFNNQDQPVQDQNVQELAQDQLVQAEQPAILIQEPRNFSGNPLIDSLIVLLGVLFLGIIIGKGGI